MTDLEKAKSYLSGGTSCVLVKGEDVLWAEKRGISPILDFLSTGKDFTGYAMADKIVGKAAAMLAVKAGVIAVYADVMSESGRDFLSEHGVYASQKTLAPYIVNREGTGRCPMEETVKDLFDVEEAYRALLKKRDELSKRT